MSEFSLKWKHFWDGKTSPLHTKNDEEYYSFYGKELSLLFDNLKYDSVLEVGCGNGALYPYLGFSTKHYVGIDLSKSMLDSFKKKHASENLELILVDAGEIYKDNKKYGLIFQNGVIQHFESNMVDEFISSSCEMLHTGGKIVIGSIPWQLCKKGYYFGEFRPSQSSFLGKVYGYLRSSQGAMGRWYSFSDFRKLANKYSLKVEFFGSLLYAYRFHVVFTKE